MSTRTKKGQHFRARRHSGYGWQPVANRKTAKVLALAGWDVEKWKSQWRSAFVLLRPTENRVTTSEEEK